MGKRGHPAIGGGEKKHADIAVLFPSAMAAYETMYTEGNKERRLDLLGWYKACCDLGLEADVVDSHDLCRGQAFDSYKVLIIPNNDCYAMNPDPEFEEKLRIWCEHGGIVCYGSDCAAAEGSFGIKAQEHQPDTIFYQEAGMVKGRKFCTYPDGECLATYLSDGGSCITRYQTGKGRQYAFGFSYGYAYDTKFVPHVPVEQKNNELYPLELMNGNILADILRDAAGIETELQKKIEKSYFKNGTIIINHTSNPYEVKQEGEKIYQYPVNESLLLPHSAVFVKMA